VWSGTLDVLEPLVDPLALVDLLLVAGEKGAGGSVAAPGSCASLGPGENRVEVLLAQRDVHR
jgi:hypothetical protein